MKTILYLFLPHPQTHKKSPFISWYFLLIYLLLFIFLRLTFNIISQTQPGVLGINASITVEKIIERTNLERQKKGLPSVKESQALNLAALAKAQNMFAEGYWAHFSPSGKDPWGFITGAGYKFSYAGENLARNFYTSEDVVQAWMNSPSHRNNLLNSRYEDIGIAVVEGVLKGQKTTLVVQMFGKTYQPIAAVPPQVDLGGQKVFLQQDELAKTEPVNIAGISLPIPDAKVDPFLTTRVLGLTIIFLVMVLVSVDFVVLRRRGVFRLTSSHVAHLSFLAVAGASVILSHAGEVL